MYNIKILKIDENRAPNKYLIHYKGWKEKWDEWVSAKSIVKMEEEGLRLQESLNNDGTRSVEDDTKVFVQAVDSEGIVDIGSPSRQMEISEDQRQAQTAAGSVKYGKMIVPLKLIQALNIDWRLVNRDHKLLTLSSSPSVSDLIADFRSKYRKKKMVGLGVFDQFTSGLKKLFDVYLGRGVLYPFERVQLRDIMTSQRSGSPSDIYPVIHFIRMLSTIFKFAIVMVSLVFVSKIAEFDG